MSQKLFFALALAGALLFMPGFNVQAQMQTTPPPPPDRESTIIPAPAAERQAAERRQTQARAQTPARATPARTQTPARSQEPAEAPAAQQTPARQDPVVQQTTPATQQTAATQKTRQTPATGIPGKGLFWGGMIGGGSQLHDTDGMSRYSDAIWVQIYDDFPVINNGFFVGYDFGLFTGQVELRIGNDNGEIEMEYYYSGSYGSASFDFFQMRLQIPLIAKMDLHLGPLVFQPLAGLYLNFVLYEDYYPSSYFGYGSGDYTTPLLGGIVGGTVGLRLGRGFLFLDARYMTDFGAVGEDDHRWYHSAASLFSVGYQYYFKQK